MLPILLGLAAGVALLQGLAPLVGWRCDSCSGGLLSLILPWAGVAFYGPLAGVARRSPSSPWLTPLLGFGVFVHASLMLESVLIGRGCPECILVAILAALAAGIQAWRRPADLATLAAGLLLGLASGFLYPYDRVELWLTRAVWPARLLTGAPSFVDRGEMLDCGDAAEVRLIVYEKDCRSCGSAQRRVLPQVREEFPTQVCVHLHELHDPPKDQRLPLFILVSKGTRVVIWEGVPPYPELRRLILTLTGKKPVSGAGVGRPHAEASRAPGPRRLPPSPPTRSSIDG